MLVSGSLDGFLGLWSLPLARLQADGQYRLQPALRHMVQAHGGPVRAIERVPQQGTLVASGGDDGPIRTWNPTTGAMDSGVTALAYSSTLEALVAATLLQIVFFDVSSGSILSTIDRSTSSPALVLTMDSHQLVLSSKGTRSAIDDGD
eukprot:Skav231352  [mRNA]  locus=scaffold1586:94585:97143:+ [translate_table: standard]